MRGAAAALAALLALAAATEPPSLWAEGPEAWVQQEPDVLPHNPKTSSWQALRRAPGERQVQLTVALRVDAARRAELERVLFEVSDPDHPKYGQHLSQEQVTELLAVPAERSEETSAYFLAAGATRVVVAPNRDMLTVEMAAAAAEAALRTELHEFGHREQESARVIRAREHYYLPARIDRHVTMVGDLLQFPGLPPRQPVGAAPTASWPNSCESSRCEGLVTPSVLAKRYRLPEQTTPGLSAGGNSMAVAEFQGQFYIDEDLSSFGESCHREVKVDANIGKKTQGAGVESELDIEYIKSVAPEVPLTVIYNDQYSLLNWANQISSLSSPPLVHSVSYGNDERQQSGKAYMFTCNTAFMKAGARGLSILFASGDQGVCGREGCGFFRKRFKPDFPAASPYITAVGGTDFLGSDIGPEMSWSDSGGGFSDTFDIPSYQAEAVSGYKSAPDAELPPQSMWNNTGRGYPDVSALGGLKNPYCVKSGGAFQGVAGTSASSPVVAGVFAKLNGLRLGKGKSPMGFLNPFIYKNPSGFQDVTSGSNNAGGRYGFKAIKGWDPATGFGTPNFEALSSLALAAGGAEAAALVV